jgi:hypothetical protein
MVFSATFNNISIISWPSVSLVGEAIENHRLAEVTDKLEHFDISSTLHHQRD